MYRAISFTSHLIHQHLRDRGGIEQLGRERGAKLSEPTQDSTSGEGKEGIELYQLLV